jgi:hypothetical protein
MNIQLLEHIRDCDTCLDSEARAYAAVDCAICGRYLDGEEYVAVSSCEEVEKYQDKGQGHIVVCEDCHQMDIVEWTEEEAIKSITSAFDDFKRRVYGH